MSLRSWTQFFPPYPGPSAPAAFRLLCAAVSGAALSLSYTGFYFSIYSWICIGLLFVVILDARPRIALACGYVHSVVFVFTGVPWIATVLAVHGGLSRLAGWGVLFLIASIIGLLTGTFAWSVQRLARRSLLLACAGAPFLWVTSEFALAHLPEISFPWNLLGYPASANLALLQLTTVTGIWGLSFTVAAFNALLAWAILTPTPRPKKRAAYLAATVFVIVAVIFAGPRFVPQASANHFARAVQPDFPELMGYSQDWFATHTRDLQEIEQLSLAPSNHPTDLLVWPEAPAPFSFEDAQFASYAAQIAIRFQHPFLAGTIEWQPATEPSISAHAALAPYNSAILLDAQGRKIFTYDKVHLVPFGEYEPFPLIHSVAASVSGEIGAFHKGSAHSVGHLPGGYTFGTFICYEAIYPGEVRRFAAAGADLLINISNDGWFGRSAAPEQHMRMARVRAVENRRWLLRVTNNGITVSVDPYGRIFRPLPPDVRAAADLPYDFRTEETIYTRFGDWFAWLCVIVSVILLALTFQKGNTAGEELLIPVADIPSSLVAGGAVGARFSSHVENRG
jgi:apolipoprotein N-acyltransferase